MRTTKNEGSRAPERPRERSTASTLLKLSDQIEGKVLRHLLRDQAKAVALLEDELRRLYEEIDEALAIMRAPDSTNDGGRANVADELRIWKHNYEVLIQDIEARDQDIESKT